MKEKKTWTSIAEYDALTKFHHDAEKVVLNGSHPGYATLTNTGGDFDFRDFNNTSPIIYNNDPNFNTIQMPKESHSIVWLDFSSYGLVGDRRLMLLL